MENNETVVEQVEEQAAGWEKSLELLLPHLESFFVYVNGGTPASLRTSKRFALSYTSLCKLLENPLRFFEYVVNTKFLGATFASKAMLIGSIADDYILSRLVAGDNPNYISLGEGDFRKNTKAGKAAYEERVAEIKAEYPDATIVDKATYDAAQRVIFSLVGSYKYGNRLVDVNEQAARLLVKNSIKAKYKFAYNCPVFGLPVVGEIDVWGRDDDGEYYIADLKSMASVDTRTFEYAVSDRLLFLQAYIYKVALKEATGISIGSYYVIAGCADNHSNIKRLSSRELGIGEALYNEAMSIFVGCLMQGAPAFIKSY